MEDPEDAGFPQHPKNPSERHGRRNPRPCHDVRAPEHRPFELRSSRLRSTSSGRVRRGSPTADRAPGWQRRIPQEAANLPRAGVAQDGHGHVAVAVEGGGAPWARTRDAGQRVPAGPQGEHEEDRRLAIDVGQLVHADADGKERTGQPPEFTPPALPTPCSGHARSRAPSSWSRLSRAPSRQASRPIRAADQVKRSAGVASRGHRSRRTAEMTHAPPRRHGQLRGARGASSRDGASGRPR